MDPKYKRGLQVIAVGIALLVAAYFNADISGYVGTLLNPPPPAVTVPAN